MIVFEVFVFMVISSSRRPQMEVFLQGSKQPLEHQSPITCLCTHLPAVSEGVSMSQSFISFSWLLLTYFCMAGQFFLSPILCFSTGTLCSVEGAQQSWLERTVWVLALCSLLATNTFWNVCFPLHSGFASLGHFSIIRMVMENSFCLLLVKLVYLEAAVHVFPSSGFSNRRFKVSYIVLHNKISCVAFLWFSLDFPWYHLLLCFGTSILAGKWSLLPIAPDVFIYIYFFEKGVLVLVWSLFVKSTTFLQMDLFDFLLSAVILLA